MSQALSFPRRPGSSVSRILLNAGEPGGIGPDLALLHLSEQTYDHCEVVVICNRDVLTQRAQQLGLKGRNACQPAHWPTLDASQPAQAGNIKLLSLPLVSPVQCGQANPMHARYVLDGLTQACQLCITGQADALVTGPLQKSSISAAGIDFTGHTEFLAELCAAPLPVMMLMANDLRVALATTHLPLKDVPTALSANKLQQVLHILHTDLQRKFGLPQPLIRVAGLNPHAGEGGHLGTEEQDFIQPVIQQLQAEGMNVHGPYPADTLFTPELRANTDAFLAMYHDQGLPVLKALGFGDAVNVTLGLPIIRTSVDHGTALDKAGTGNIHTSSLACAMQSALQLASSHKALPSADILQP